MVNQLNKKARLEQLLTEIDEELQQETDIWLDEIITRLEKMCQSARGRGPSQRPRLAPIPEVQNNIESIFKLR